MYIKKIMVLVFMINMMLFSCFGKVYPITDMIEGKDMTLSFYVELKEEPFTGMKREDKILLGFISALVDKDVARINTFLALEDQIESNQDLSEYEYGKLKSVVKYLYNDYAMFCGKSNLNSPYHYVVRRNEKKLHIMVLNTPATAIVESSLDPFLNDKIKSVKIDLSKFATVEYGTNEVIKIHFRYLNEDDEITQDLKQTKDRLNRAYLKKDFDALAHLVSPGSLSRVLAGLMNNNPNPDLKSSLNEPFGAIDMGSVYIYLGLNKEKETIFMDKYAKYDGKYRLVNYHWFGGSIGEFLGSDEFKFFIRGKIIEKEKRRKKKKKSQSVIKEKVTTNSSLSKKTLSKKLS